MIGAARRRQGPLIWAIKEAIVECYDASDWVGLGYLTDCQDYIKRHTRLLRSLRFGDEDYPRHALSSLECILRSNPNNLSILLNDEKVRVWLLNNHPELFNEFAAELPTEAVTVPILKVTSSTVERAISDAEYLMRTNGPISSVDRVHTTLHGYFLAVCKQAGIEHGNRVNMVELFSLLRNEHPALQNLGPRAEDIVVVLRSLGKVIDKLNTVRNEASLAHPNRQPLDEPEAFLMINAARTVLHYLNAKLEQT